MSIFERSPSTPPEQHRSRALRWLVPLLVIFPVLTLWKQRLEKDAAEEALAHSGTDDDPIAFLRKPPEELLCGGEAPVLCAHLDTWKKAGDCAGKRAALAELKAAAAQFAEAPSFMKLAGGVVNVETMTKACKDAPP